MPVAGRLRHLLAVRKDAGPNDLLSRATQGVRERETSRTQEGACDSTCSRGGGYGPLRCGLPVGHALPHQTADGRNSWPKTPARPSGEVDERESPHEHVAERKGSNTACMRCGEVFADPIHHGAEPICLGEVDEKIEQGFSITWKDGAYRVSVPNLLGESERLEVVPRSHLEQVERERDEERRIASFDRNTLLEERIRPLEERLVEAHTAAGDADMRATMAEEAAGEVEGQLVEARVALEAVTRNDKTPPYSYAGARGDKGRSANASRSANARGEYPSAGERWLTPCELAKGALARTQSGEETQ
jgi:hypothetical protein